jgi:sugar phosphate isomerase/epimerase
LDSPVREPVIPTFYSLSKPIPQLLDDLVNAGVRLIELHGDEPEHHIDLTGETEIDSLAQVVARLPLTVHSVHCAFSKPSEEAWDISHPDARKREAALERRTQVIKSAARLGAHHVIIHVGVRERGEERLAYSRASLERLVEIARGAGVRIAVENLPPDHLGGSLAEIQCMLEGLDGEVAGFCLDTGHAMLGADRPADYIRALGHRMLAIHWHANDCADDDHLFPGADGTDWRDFFTALDEVNYESPVTIEAVPPDGVSIDEAVREARVALRERRTPRFD